MSTAAQQCPLPWGRALRSPVPLSKREQYQVGEWLVACGWLRFAAQGLWYSHPDDQCDHAHPIEAALREQAFRSAQLILEPLGWKGTGSYAGYPWQGPLRVVRRSHGLRLRCSVLAALVREGLARRTA